MPTYGVNAVASAVPPWAVQQRIGTSAARYALDSVLMPRTDAGLSYIDYRSGVMASGDGDDTHLAMRVTAPGTGMSVTVAQGNAVINTSNQGAYMCCLDSTKTLTIPASSATTRRFDLVCARVYDDNNSALAGTTGVRQFTVELVQGDATTGQPVVPEAPAGAIPLAWVDVKAGATVVTNDDLADVRGPGIVARGGMRALYRSDSVSGAESYEQAGAYPGDQRWVHTNGFQHQVYYGESQGWRGVFNAQVFNNSPKGGGWMWTGLYAGARREWTRVTIPYPGTPYMIYPSARVHCFLSALTGGEASLTLNSSTGTVLSWAGMDIGQTTGGANPADTLQTMNIAPIMWGPFTTSIDVVLSGYVTSTGRPGGGGIGCSNTNRTVLSVVVFPSTVAPPGAGATPGGNPIPPAPLD